MIISQETIGVKFITGEGDGEVLYFITWIVPISELHLACYPMTIHKPI